MSRNVCARCSKPVYFAERKTSLGRDWHPTCLRCSECGKVLSPGQHAEHKGNPYCHTPCYKALFGPALLGYGSNLASPANFAKKDNAAEFGHDYDDDVYKREIYSNSRTSAMRRQRQRRSAPPSIVNHDFSALSVMPESVPQVVGTDVGGNTLPAASSTGLVEQAARYPERPTISVGGPDSPSEAYASPRNVSDLNSHSVVNSGVLTVDNSESFPVLNSGSHVVTSSNLRSMENSTVHDGSSEITNSERSAGSAASKSDHRAYSRHTSARVRSVDNPGGVEGVLAGEKSVSVTNVISSNSRRSKAQPVSSKNPPFPQSAPEPQLFKSRLNVAPSLRDILEKVESFNSHYEGKIHHQMTVDPSSSGEVKICGPLRIYWGLSRPIELRQCDDVPAPPISKWRHSLCVNLNDAVGQNSNASQKLQGHGGPGGMSPHRPARGIDDSILLSPSSSADEVVMRRQKVRKFNTVAYRSDAPTRWKRASINGHIFNYDTSVFIPVLGSSTSVIADSTMTSPVVIQTLLEKFKVENSPGEYVLSVVTESGDQTQERLLGETDRPLLERLQLGPDDHNAKIFIKERRMQPEAIVPDIVQLPIMEVEEEETLPAEVEQLMILPQAVLKGFMIKFEKDEEREVRLLKAKYERLKRKIRARLEELKTA